MYSKSLVASLALLAVASPAFSAPLPVPESHAELEARLSLPKGAITGLLKSLGGGILTGGALSGLLSLLGGGDAAAPAARELSPLEARGIASILEKLVGAGAESLESVLKKAILGGVASGVAVEGVNAVAGQRRAGIPVAVVDDVAKVAEKGLASVLGNGVASGLGSALGGLGIGAILDKLFGKSDAAAKRSFSDLSDDEVIELLEYVNDMNTKNSKRELKDLTDDEVVSLLEYINDMNNGNSVRALNVGSIGKGLAGLVAGLAATQGAESVIQKLESLFGGSAAPEARSWNDLD
ncbi:hypothetical protein B0H10DRAFT_2040330 [Mycena sp. CBHHK59/15]|nr:hypothetical protein B0H10DRAFT_2040330 [Mycena sp. CBHHK59/15]